MNSSERAKAAEILKEISKEYPFKIDGSWIPLIRIKLETTKFATINLRMVKIVENKTYQIKFSEGKEIIYDLYKKEDEEKFIKEVQKRIKNREKTAEKNKHTGQTHRLGRINFNTEEWIQSASFEMNLDSENIPEANVTLTGYIKLFKKPQQRVIFDIDKNEIRTTSKNKVIDARNVNVVLDELRNLL